MLASVAPGFMGDFPYFSVFPNAKHFTLLAKRAFRTVIQRVHLVRTRRNELKTVLGQLVNKAAEVLYVKFDLDFGCGGHEALIVPFENKVRNPKEGPFDF